MIIWGHSNDSLNELERNIPVVHLDPTIRVNFFSVLKPSDARRWISFSMAHKASGASSGARKALRPLHQGRRCFRKRTAICSILRDHHK